VHTADIYWKVDDRVAGPYQVICQDLGTESECVVIRTADMSRGNMRCGNSPIVAHYGIKPGRDEMRHCRGERQALESRSFAVRYYLIDMLDEIMPQIGRDPSRCVAHVERTFEVSPEMRHYVESIH
jgi:hypothetical protein